MGILLHVIIGAAVILASVVVPLAGVFFYYASRGRRIIITLPGYTLKARVYGKIDNDNPRPAVLFLPFWSPGNEALTTTDLYAGICSKKFNYICMTISMRGKNLAGQRNSLTRADYLADVIAAYDYLAGMEGVDKDSLTVAGESFGSHMACLLSAKRTVRNLVLRVPTDFPDESFDSIPHAQLVGRRSWEWKAQKRSYKDSYLLKAVHEFKGNILIVASSRDRLVPLQTTENIIAAVKDRSRLKYIRLKAGHALVTPGQQYRYIQIFIKWMQQHN